MTNIINKKNKLNKRFTIGLLVVSLFDDYGSGIWSGVINFAEEYDLNLLSFVGGSLKSKYNFDYQRNAVYDLIDKEYIDGLIVLSGCLSNFVDLDFYKKFLKKFYDIPIVSISADITGIPSVLSDNEKGIRDIMAHLIKDHGYKNIAFMKGTDENPESVIRLSTYKKVLDEYNIPFNKDLIIPGDFHIYSAGKEVSNFIKNSKVKIDAIICGNDIMAINSIKKLTSSGYNIPVDIAITGFDNISYSRSIFPSLTTISQYPFELGYQAFSTLYDILNNKKVAEKKIIPTNLIIRRSCGCFPYEESFPKSIIRKNKNYSISNLLNDDKFNLFILDKMKSIFVSLKDQIYKKWTQMLIKALINDLLEKTLNDFLKTFEEVIFDSYKYKIDTLSWNSFISILMNKTREYIDIPEKLVILDNIWREALVVTGNMVEYQKSHFMSDYINQGLLLYTSNESLITVFDMDKFKNIIEEEFPRLGIPSMFISLYSEDNRESAKFLIGYDKSANKIYESSDKVYKSRKLFPEDINVFDHRRFYVVMALFFRDIQIGFIVFENGPLDGLLYESLSIQISSSLRGIGLMDKIKNHSYELEEKVVERTVKLAKANKEIEETNKKLKQLDSMKNDFIANITHDFRSPLTGILNISDLALKYEECSDNHKNNYKLIYEASLKLKNTIDKLLELARLDAKGIKIKIERINIIKFLDKLIKFYSSSVIGSNIKIIKKYKDTNVKFIYTDGDKLEEIIHNIVSNAIKFVDTDKGIITIDLFEIDNYLRITISDNGIGIEKNKLDVIFNRFEQAHEHSYYRGTGIGLAYSRQLIEYLKGNIWAESEGVNKGAKFIIELPLDYKVFNADSVDTGKERNNLIKNIELKNIIESDIKKRIEKEDIIINITNLNKNNEYDIKKSLIMIIDDDTDILNIAMKYLQNNGYLNFILATNGEVAVNEIVRYKPQMIICDYSMPGLRGYEIHEIILKNKDLKDIPFIFLSAVLNKEVIYERRKKGACAYLKKPIDETELILTVEYHLNKYLNFLEATKKI